MVATVRYGRRGRYQETVLYDRAQAVPRPQATPAQLAALKKAGQVRTENERRRRDEEAAECAQEEADWQAWLDDQAAGGRAGLREIVTRGNWVALDTETTELDCPEVVEIAVVAPGGAILFQSLVRPLGVVSDGARAVHGITEAELAAAPGWPEVWAQLRPHVEGKAVVAWNAEFDRDAVTNSSRLQELEVPDLDWCCAMRIGAPIWGEWSDYWESFRYVSLAEACCADGVEVPGAWHRRALDATRLAALLNHGTGIVSLQ